jgi:hypothetical protein
VERKVTCFWKEPRAAEAYQTAVSLHGHTIYSQESLNFISDLVGKVRLLRWLLAMKERPCGSLTFAWTLTAPAGHLRLRRAPLTMLNVAK